MKSFYTLASLAFLLLLSSGCSKDFLKSYDKRVIGTWKIIDIDRFGFNGSDNLPFSEGDLLTFSEDGGLNYMQSGRTYGGSWDITRETRDNKTIKSLYVTAVDFNNQSMRSEYFNEMKFTGTNRFAAFINYGTRTYVYRFLKQ